MTHDAVHANYIGRFAPSPTGPLHLGSLLTAVAAYLDCRAHHGRFLVRIEDLDPAREIPGSDQTILTTLELFGIEWDEPVVYQSQRRAYYQEALDQLWQQQLVYRCRCSRRFLREHATRGQYGLIYPNTCRNLDVSATERHAVRVRVNNEPIDFTDPVFGTIQQRLEQDLGDFIVVRSDGWFAYQFAVVVDDALQHITHVVRGSDLFDSTPRQIYLQQCLHYPKLNYLHLPLIVKPDGIKLSKQTGAHGVTLDCPSRTLHHCLTLLGQNPPDELRHIELPALWQWSVSHWHRENLTQHPIPVNDGPETTAEPPDAPPDTQDE